VSDEGLLDPAEGSVRAADQALTDVRARLHSHGGDVRVLHVNEEGEAELEFIGACCGCPAIPFTFTAIVEPALMGRAGVRSVMSRQVRSSPHVMRRVRMLAARGSVRSNTPDDQL
jgi:Fe-S cluster biogenesis protein NfuA